MKPEDVIDAMNDVDGRYIDETAPEARKRRRRIWPAAIAAALVIALCAAAVLPRGGVMQTKAYALKEAVYPEMAPYPTGNPEGAAFEKKYDAWFESVRDKRQNYRDSGRGIESFVAATAREILSERDGKNKLYSPVNVYMALAMLAEITEGNTREQILSLAGSESMELMREKADRLWQGVYWDDGASTCKPGASFWLRDDGFRYNEATLDTLANSYYASSFAGKPGTEEYDKALRAWVNENTGGLLKDQAETLSMDERTVIDLVTTLLLKVKWSGEFSEKLTEPGTFHGAEGDTQAQFMHQTDFYGKYFWGEKFAATIKHFSEYDGFMGFVLPDEGVSPEELMEDEEAMSFMTGDFLWNYDPAWENMKVLKVNMSIPKFDIAEKTDLTDSLKALGVTDCFSFDVSDFSPLTDEDVPLAVSAVNHGVRVAIDEEGVTAAAFTEIPTAGAGMPPDDEVDFVLDRPFVFFITGSGGAMLFVGVVNIIE